MVLKTKTGDVIKKNPAAALLSTVARPQGLWVKTTKAAHPAPRFPHPYQPYLPNDFSKVI